MSSIGYLLLGLLVLLPGPIFGVVNSPNTPNTTAVLPPRDRHFCHHTLGNLFTGTLFSNTDCPDPGNSVCHNGLCQCRFGYTWSPKTSSCINVCTTNADCTSSFLWSACINGSCQCAENYHLQGASDLACTRNRTSADTVLSRLISWLTITGLILVPGLILAIATMACIRLVERVFCCTRKTSRKENQKVPSKESVYEEEMVQLKPKPAYPNLNP